MLSGRCHLWGNQRFPRLSMGAACRQPKIGYHWHLNDSLGGYQTQDRMSFALSCWPCALPPDAPLLVTLWHIVNETD